MVIKKLKRFFRSIIPQKPKDISSLSDDELNEFLNDDLSKLKWMQHFFKIYFAKRENESIEEFNLRVERIKGELFSYLAIYLMGENGEQLNKKMTILIEQEDENLFYYLIRFCDMSEEDKNVKEFVIREKKSPSKEEDYLFTAYQTLLSVNIHRQIQYILEVIFNQEPKRVMDFFTFVDGKPYTYNFNQVQYMGYSIEDRIKVAKKFPNIDNVLFESDIKTFISYILDKRNHDDHMKKYCAKVDKLIKKYQL